jgi:hypothetical protein
VTFVPKERETEREEGRERERERERERDTHISLHWVCKSQIEDVKKQ